MPFLFGLGLVVLFIFLGWIRVLNEYERGVIFRLGRIIGKPVGPGLFILVAPPIVDRMTKVDLRTVTFEVPPQDVITKDNVSLKVNTVVYYRVIDPVKAIVEVADFHYATSQMAQTTLRSIAGQVDLDQLLSNREELSHKIQTIMDENTHPWGVKVSNVEIKYIDLPQDMQRAMARQAEAERDRRAKIINAEGESQAAEKLVEAAKTMGSHPMALQMRYLQTVVEVGTERNTMILFPIPIDLLEAFKKKPE